MGESRESEPGGGRVSARPRANRRSEGKPGFGGELTRRALIGAAVGAAVPWLSALKRLGDEEEGETGPGCLGPKEEAPGEADQKFEDKVNVYFNRTRVRNNYNAIMEQQASQPAARGDETSKLDYATWAFEQSDVLPAFLKQILPFVPFQESSYKNNANSGIAKGPWQFIKETGRHYGLVQNGRTDERYNFKKSTHAAVEYFEDLYLVLLKDRNYKALQRKYGVHEDDFLNLMVVNSFNSGPHHMLTAMKMMVAILDGDVNVRDDQQVDRYAKMGSRGLYSWVTDVYSQHSEWQKNNRGRPYRYKYLTESPKYTIKIEAYKRMYLQQSGEAQAVSRPRLIPLRIAVSLDKLGQGRGDRENEPVIERTFINTRIATVLTGFLAGLADWKLTDRSFKRRKKQPSRRDFFRLSKNVAKSTTLGAAAGGSSWIVNTSADLYDERLQPPPKKLSLRGVESKKKELDEMFKLLKTGGFRVDHIKVDDVIQKAKSGLGAVATGWYDVHLYMADAAYYLYQQKSDDTYIQIAKYFYDRCGVNANAQKQGKLALPSGGMPQVDQRLKYLEGALKVVDPEFK